MRKSYLKAKKEMLSQFDKLSVSASENQTRSTSTDEVTRKGSYYDKHSGSYGRVTAKESVSSGDYINRGRVGYKDEYKASSTVRVGDDKGYIEYHKQEKVTRVDYSGRNTNSSGNRDAGVDSAVDDDDFSQADDAVHADNGAINHDVPVHADNDGFDHNDFSDDGVGYDDFYDGGGYDDFYDGGGYGDYYYSDGD